MLKVSELLQVCFSQIRNSVLRCQLLINVFALTNISIQNFNFHSPRKQKRNTMSKIKRQHFNSTSSHRNWVGHVPISLTYPMHVSLRLSLHQIQANAGRYPYSVVSCPSQSQATLFSIRIYLLYPLLYAYEMPTSCLLFF